MTPSSGDHCHLSCGGRLHVRNSKRRGSKQIQYLSCDRCNAKPPNNKIIRDAKTIRRRSVAA